MWLVYLITVNAAAFLLMLADKQKAKKKRWRIRESTLLWMAVAGGSLGSILGMFAFHHKTCQPKFRLGLPLILSLQIVAAVILPSIIK